MSSAHSHYPALHLPARTTYHQNPFQSNKSFKTRHVSKHLLANIVLSVLVCYLILAVEQLRAGNCSSQGNEDNPNFSTHEQLVTSPQRRNQSQQPSTAELQIKRLDAVARRTRTQPPCVDGTRAKSFLMIFMGHSGSSAITSELKGHPQVHVELAELVDHQDVFNTTKALQATREFFDRGIALGKTPGFKIRPMHILNEPENWRALARQYRTRIIWQYRQNLFKGAVGEYSNRYLNDTSVVEGLRKDMPKEERCKIGVGCSYSINNIPFLHTIMKNMFRSQQSIVDAVHEISKDGRYCVRELPYEDYLYDREDSLADIFKFLGLRQEVTKPLRYKATDDNLCKVVENWEETCNAFYPCTVFQHMIDDPRNNCFCTLRKGTTKHCSL